MSAPAFATSDYEALKSEMLEELNSGADGGQQQTYMIKSTNEVLEDMRDASTDKFILNGVGRKPSPRHAAGIAPGAGAGMGFASSLFGSGRPGGRGVRRYCSLTKTSFENRYYRRSKRRGYVFMKLTAQLKRV